MILCLIVLLFIIIFFLFKFISIKESLKDINKQLNKKMTKTNNLITTFINDKDINNLANALNKNLKKLHDKERQYENKNQQLYRLITNVSHDIRTPLTAIKGYVDLLKKEKDQKKRKQYIDIIDIKVRQLVELSEQLLDYTKNLDLKNYLIKEKICINNLLEEAILSYYALFKEKKINPHVNICSKKIYKMIDKNMFMRILENIISNAIKYADKDINITLLDNGKIIFANKTNSLDKISVKKLFNRYFTVEDGKKSTGIGLSIAKQFVELNGGNIKADYKNGFLILEIELK